MDTLNNNSHYNSNNLDLRTNKLNNPNNYVGHYVTNVNTKTINKSSQSLSDISSRILVIDDELDICLLVSAVLKGMGHTVKYANTLTTGLELLISHNPEVVFLDLNLPDGYGLSIVPTIKSFNSKIKVIIISAYDLYNDKGSKEVFNLVDDFIPKPFSMGLIRQVLTKVNAKQSD